MKSVISRPGEFFPLKAGNKIAQGKRAARRPGFVAVKSVSALKGRNTGIHPAFSAKVQPSWAAGPGFYIFATLAL